MTFNQALLIPQSAKALGPTQGINGEPLANGWDYGDSYDELVAGTNPPSEYFPRSPQVLPLSSGTLVQFAAMENGNGADNTAQYIAVQTSIDGGKTSTHQPAAYTVAGFVATTGVGHNAVNQYSVVQLANGTIVMLLSLQPFGSNTSGSWLDFSGNTPPQTQGMKLYVVTFTESGGVLTVASGPTEVTSQFIVLDDRNNMAISAAAAGAGSVIKITVSGNTDALNAGRYYRVRILNWTGSDHATLNYSENGQVAFYAKATDATHLELQGTAFVATATGNASPEFAWLSPSCGGGCIVKGGAHDGAAIFPLYGRWDTDASGTATMFSARTTDGATFTMSSQTTANTTIAEIEGGICPQSTAGKLYMTMRQGSGSTRLRKLSTDGGDTWGAQAAVAELISTPTLGTVINVGGANLVLIAPNTSDTTKRSRLTAWLSSDDGATWPAKRVLNWDCSAYSHAAYFRGKIFFAFERDYANEVFAGAPGRIGFGVTNLAAIKQAATYPDEVQYYFNDLPSGQTAWTGQSGVRDWGAYGGSGVCFNHHGVVNGAPVYASDGLTFAGTNGDYLLLASGAQRDSFYDPDYLGTDSGDFTLELEISSSAGHGMIFGGDSTVGSGGKGILAVINGDQTATFWISDGTHSPAITASVALLDGNAHRYVFQRDTASGKLHLWHFNATTGDALETIADVTDTTTVAQGSLSNATTDKTLCRAGGNATGEFTQAMKWRVFRFVRKAIPVVHFLPMPIVKPTAETFPAAPSGSPGDTSVIAAGQLKLWIGRCDAHYGNRSRTLASPGKGRKGDSAIGLVDAASGYFTTAASATLPILLNKDATVGGYWTWPNVIQQLEFDPRSIGPFDAIGNFSNSWAIGGKFRIPAAVQATIRYPLRNYDGTRGFRIDIGNGANKFLLAAANSNGNFAFVGYVSNAYVADTWYYWLVYFNGTNGAGASGLVSYLVPLASNPVSLATVQAGKNSSLSALAGATTAGTGSSTLPIGCGYTTDSVGRYDLGSDNFIAIGCTITDANVLSLANASMAS